MGTCSGVIQPLQPRLSTCNELRLRKTRRSDGLPVIAAAAALVAAAANIASAVTPDVPACARLLFRIEPVVVPSLAHAAALVVGGALAVVGLYLLKRRPRLGGRLLPSRNCVRATSRRSRSTSSLYRFNAKFSPRWTARYLLYERSVDLPRIGLAAMRVEAQLPMRSRHFSRRAVEAT